MPAAVRPKGKATKIKEAVMGPMLNQPKKRKNAKRKYIEDRITYEESSRVK